MKNLLDSLIIEDPTTRIVVQIIVILVGGWITAKVIHLLVLLIKSRVTSKTATDLDDRIVEVLEKSVKRILIFMAFYFAAHRLEKMYEGAWLNYVDGVFFVIMVFLSTLLLANVLKTIVEWYLATVARRTDSPVDEELIPLLRRLTNMLLYSIALMICLDHFHIDIKALVVSLGVGSFAIALAAQETFSNMIAGFVIMVDRPFRVGDRIRIPSMNQVGDVVKVGLRSTQILDFDNNVVTIPNAQIVKSEIINFAYPEPAMRLRIEVSVAYGTDTALARQILLSLPPQFKGILKDPIPEAVILGFGESAINLALICRVVHYKEHFDIGDQVRDKILVEFAKAGIEIPFPQRVVYVKEGGNLSK